MQPIPITPAPVEISNASAVFGTVSLIAAALFAVAALFFLVCFKRRESYLTLAILGAGMTFGLAALGLTSFATVPFDKVRAESQAILDAVDARTDTVQTKIQKDYGLKLNAKEVNALEYPEKAPKEDFKIYGQLVSSNKGSQLKLPSDSVYLIWTDGELKLAEGSGKSFTEIKSKG